MYITKERKMDIESLARAGIVAKDVQEEYSEFSKIPFSIVYDLSLQNFRCVKSNECVLLINQPFYIFRWQDGFKPNEYLRYGCILKHFWHEGGEKTVKILKSVDSL